MAKNIGKGARKRGRNIEWCKAYRARHQREKNKVKRLVRYLRKHPLNDQAGRALEKWKAAARVTVS